jgi:hypothetical protein
MNFIHELDCRVLHADEVSDIQDLTVEVLDSFLSMAKCDLETAISLKDENNKIIFTERVRLLSQLIDIFNGKEDY